MFGQHELTVAQEKKHTCFLHGGRAARGAFVRGVFIRLPGDSVVRQDLQRFAAPTWAQGARREKVSLFISMCLFYWCFYWCFYWTILVFFVFDVFLIEIGKWLKFIQILTWKVSGVDSSIWKLMNFQHENPHFATTHDPGPFHIMLQVMYTQNTINLIWGWFIFLVLP